MPRPSARTIAIAVVAALMAAALAVPVVLEMRKHARAEMDIAAYEVQHVQWVALPTKAQAVAVYPAKARALPAEPVPKVFIHCRVAERGALEHCVVVTETPRGYGFGAAALALVPKIRLYPVDPDGSSQIGRPITVPITFPKDMLN